MIQFRDFLNDEELLQLQSLMDDVNAYDSTSYSLPGDADLYWLYMEPSKEAADKMELTAVLCVYHMGDMRNDREIDELLCFTRPAFRNAGRCRALFACAHALLRPCLRFCVQETDVCRSFLRKTGAVFAYEEQIMELALASGKNTASCTASEAHSEKKSAAANAAAPVSVSVSCSDSDAPVFEEDGELIRVSSRFGECSLYPQGSRCYLFGVLVYRRFRGQGRGTSLLKNVLGKLREDGFHTVYLEVSSANLPAVRLYRKLGFQITERIACYYKD
ncbi:MAG: GNAT family N-acetyltransferase [Eubacteriales bacterium]|nr:GNAT family N-acetyltransferase [Eubacteriales bacterium]